MVGAKTAAPKGLAKSSHPERFMMTDSIVRIIIAIIYFYFYLYIYPPDSQKSDGDANTEGKQLPRPASGDAKILLSA